MKNTYLYSLILLLLVSCSPSDGGEDEIELRINFTEYALSLTHNSHLNRSFNNEANSFSVTAMFEVFLSENTDPTNIQKFGIVDGNNKGWVFTHEQVLEAYNESNNSLVFEDVQLRILDAIQNEQLTSRILDENDEVVFSRNFTILDNELPLPASTSIEIAESDTLESILNIDFYDEHFTGGSIPFNVSFYPTYFSSNSFSLVWLDANKNVINEGFTNIDNVKPINSSNQDDIYFYNFLTQDIPEGAAYVYTNFRRGGWRGSGKTLRTQILSLN
tara:strand:+ start:60873 stop:61694 length:822 start_codon:yes stop_codon:yes gene_type:complete